MQINAYVLPKGFYRQFSTVYCNFLQLFEFSADFCEFNHLRIIMRKNPCQKNSTAPKPRHPDFSSSVFSQQDHDAEQPVCRSLALSPALPVSISVSLVCVCGELNTKIVRIMYIFRLHFNQICNLTYVHTAHCACDVCVRVCVCIAGASDSTAIQHAI